jgi:hypothetical protein
MLTALGAYIQKYRGLRPSLPMILGQEKTPNFNGFLFIAE